MYPNIDGAETATAVALASCYFKFALRTHTLAFSARKLATLAGRGGGGQAGRQAGKQCVRG